MNYSGSRCIGRDETLQTETALGRTIAEIKRTQVLVQQQEHMWQFTAALLELVGVESAVMVGS